MGSLMAGWDSPFRDPKNVEFQRNKSLTRGEIEAFWKFKKKTEEEHLSEENLNELETEGRLHRSSTFAAANTKMVSLMTYGAKLDTAKFSKRSCWRTRSNWAFLNEPPVVATEEGPSYKHASKCNATEVANSNAANSTKIIT